MCDDYVCGNYMCDDYMCDDYVCDDYMYDDYMCDNYVCGDDYVDAMSIYICRHIIYIRYMRFTSCKYVCMCVCLYFVA